MPTFRDRFFTPQVARAIVSPSAILATGVGVAVGIALPVSAPIAAIAAVGLGLAGLAARVGIAVPRGTPGAGGRIDPFTLDDPWRRLMQDTLAARGRFDDAVRRTQAGPVRDRLSAIAATVDANLDDAWRTAVAGQALSEAYRRMDAQQAGDELAQLQAGGITSETARATVASLEAQVDTARRMWDTITSTHDRLRLLNEQLDEAATRAIELSVGVFRPDQFAKLEQRLGSITQELDALRAGLDDTATAEQLGTGATDVMDEVDRARRAADDPGRADGPVGGAEADPARVDPSSGASGAIRPGGTTG